MIAYRAALPMVFAIWFLQLAGGILGLVTPLGLGEMGVSLSNIGLVASLYAVGFMGGALSAPYWISRIGNIRCFSFAAAICCISCLSMDMWQTPAVWAVLRLLIGLAFSLMVTAIESWMGAAISAAQRGGVMSIYHLVAKAALLLGPLIIIGNSSLDHTNYVLSGIFLAAALIPVCITKQNEPPRPVRDNKSIFSLVHTAPSAVIGAFFAGAINSAVMALLPLFMQPFSDVDSLTLYAALALAAVNIGGLISQWPMGWLSDHIDRRIVVGITAIIAAVAGAIIFFFADSMSMTMLLVLLAVWGAGSLVYYGICVAHGVDRSKKEQITQMMSLLLFVWATGAVIGPFLLGLVMNTALGVKGLFGAVFILHLFLAFVMIVRNSSRASTPEEAQTDWHPTLPSTSAMIDIDPRTPAESIPPRKAE